MIDLLIVGRADPAVVASTRYRVARYLPYMSKAGIRYKLVLPPRRQKAFFFLWPLFYLQVMFFGMRAKTILVQKDIFFLPIWKFFKRLGKRIVYDFDDEIFVEGPAGHRHFYCLSFPRRPAREILGEMIRLADHVTVANNFLLDFARQFNDQVEVVPMPVNLDLFPA